MKFLPLLLSALAMPVLASAATLNPLPVDPAVRTATLSNGLTYYIRHNAETPKRADFFIAQRVGSVHERHNEQGLAHFLEHMAFNGTEHFPGKSLITYLESIGVRFGANLNAYTSTDETVYNISNVPVQRPSTVDSCLLVLRDWSCGITLDTDEINDERGVITGEYRQRMSNPSSRMQQQFLPRLYGNGRRGHRMPLGTLEVINGFEPQVIRNFYTRWYNPQNQAIIAVGDFNVDSVESRIKTMFGNIPVRPQALRTTDPDPAVPSARAITVSDPDQGVAMLQLYLPRPSKADNTIQGLRDSYITWVAAQMLAQRYDAIEQSPNAAFYNLGTGDVRMLMSKSNRAWVTRTHVHPGREAEALASCVLEIKRAAQHGFTQPELERAALDYSQQLDSRYLARNKTNNTAYAKRYAQHFIHGGSLPSEDTYNALMRGVMSSVKLEDINARFAQLADSLAQRAVVIAYLPQADSARVSEAMLSNAVAEAAARPVEPYTDSYVPRPILSSLPAAGRITKQSKIKKFDAQQWTLSNGIRVMLRPNPDADNDISIFAEGLGGISAVYNPAEAHNYRVINDVTATFKADGLSRAQQQKELVGKTANVRININNMDESVQIATTPLHLESALQTMYARLVNPAVDSAAMEVWRQTMRTRLGNGKTSAATEMGDSIHAAVYGGHPLGIKTSVDDVDRASAQDIMDIYRNRFGDMSHFTFYITGNFDADSIRPLVERYIASLPGNGRRGRQHDIGYRYAAPSNRVIDRPMSTPGTITYCLYTGQCPYNLSNVLTGKVLSQIIKGRLRDEIRERRGLTYAIKTHIGINPRMNGDDPSMYLMPIYIKVKPGHDQEVYAVIDSTLTDICNGNIDPAELNSAKAYLLKDADTRLTDNGYWINVLRGANRYSTDMHTNYESTIRSLTPQKTAAFARRLLHGANRTTLTMRPTP